MTKKYFDALAAALKRRNTDWLSDGPMSNDYVSGAKNQWEGDIREVALVCARFNPNFDRERFLAACGVEGQ